MLLEELANELVEVTSSLVGGRTINIMNTSGVIVASTEHERVGSYHQGAIEAIRTGKVVNIRRDQRDRYPGAKEGCNMPLRVNGRIIGVVGIFGDPEEIRDIAHLLEVYATKYYQMEAMLQPRLAENTLRSRLLTSLLSPASSAMSEVHSLAENLNIHFRFPVYTIVFSSGQRLSLPGNTERLCRKLEEQAFLKKQHDIWGTVDERLVLVCSELEGRSLHTLRSLTGEGYRISLGMPCTNLWQIQNAYNQALILDLSGDSPYSDIRDPAARCRYMLSRTAGMEEPFLEEMYQKLTDAFGREDCAILLESIRTYYDCEKGVAAASRKLFIHKNTLQYRVRRVLDTLDMGKFPAFQQEYLIRLILAHVNRKSRSQDLEK